MKRFFINYTLGIAGLGLLLLVPGSAHAASCAGIRLSATYTVMPKAGGVGSVVVNAPAGCVWSMQSSSAWIRILSGSRGSGAAAVSFQVLANPNRTSRRGNIAAPSLCDTQIMGRTTTSCGPSSLSMTIDQQ